MKGEVTIQSALSRSSVKWVTIQQPLNPKDLKFLPKKVFEEVCRAVFMQGDSPQPVLQAQTGAKANSTTALLQS